MKKCLLLMVVSAVICETHETYATDPWDEENLIHLSSNKEKKTSSPIKINLISDDSSQEDSLDQILLNLTKADPSLNSLKRKRDEISSQHSDDDLSVQEFELNYSSESSGSYESESEGSFVIDGHYGSDEEAQTDYASSSSNEDRFHFSSNDEYEPEPKHFKKDNGTSISKLPSRRSKRFLPSPKKKCSQSLLSSPLLDEADEDIGDESLLALEKAPDFMKDMIKIGLHVKVLSNVYLGSVSEKANVFLPWYKADFDLADGKNGTKEGWFKTEKDEICVFASGGLHHIWEKNVSHVSDIFFKEKIKIIRAHWIQKHPYKNKHEKTLAEEFAGEKQRELHSEYYYDIFFREYFVPQLEEQLRKSSAVLKSLTIHAFSWWDVCDMCEKTLANHKKLLGEGVSLSYQIAARKRYPIKYPPTSCVENNRISIKEEQRAWKDLWGRIDHYTEKQFKHSKEKRKFWTKTYEGLEICKWFGQAFSEREYELDGRETEEKKGSILSFYKEKQPHKMEALENLLSYLRKKNWDLSCWYKGNRLVNTVQPKWKRHWNQVCVPHFGWEEVHFIEAKKEEEDTRRGRRPRHERQIPEIEDKKEWNGNCEMCGYEGIENVFRIFHRKYYGSEKFLKLPEEVQNENEGSRGFTHATPIDHLPSHLQKKRHQSLCVGSECVKVLFLKESDIKEWRENKNDEEMDSKTRDQAKRLYQDDTLFEVEKDLKKKERKSKRMGRY